MVIKAKVADDVAVDTVQVYVDGVECENITVIKYSEQLAEVRAVAEMSAGLHKVTICASDVANNRACVWFYVSIVGESAESPKF